ncbi:choice-of-anchor Q domain-containing protein [Tenacibaculum sp. ZS6-P6]|uniref:choice-of-anchor Q domain-containing protein n=1 Tax=Tenacibaculum sp. ZS6-P6 TaxID=3447503 RepID=UPI003F983E17
MKKKILSLSTFLFLFFYLQVNATVYYVNLNATGNNDGSSWQNAFNSLDTALSSSTSGDEIWVAKGTYKPSFDGFNIPSGVKIYGGFIGNESNLNERDYSTNTVTLDGNIGDLSKSTDNANHVVFMRNVSASTRLDGFKIINGRANNFSNDSKGGGLYNLNGAPTIANCQFYDNFSDDFGGGICSESGNIKIDNCDISNNTVEGIGAGVYLSQNGTAIITNSKINSNTSIYNSGGGIASGNGFDSLIIDRTEISGNTVQDFGGAITIGDDTSLKIYNSLFLGNVARLRIINMHTTFNLQSHKVVNCTFSGNKSTERVSKSSTIVFNDNTEIANSIFWDNEAPDGNIYRFNTLIDPLVSNCIIENGHESGNNNITNSPEFNNPSSKDFAPFTNENLDYSLKPNSLGINAGNNNFLSNAFNKDFTGAPRQYGSKPVDIGAFELQNDSTLSIKEDDFFKTRTFYNKESESIEIINYNLYNLNYIIYDIKGRSVKKGNTTKDISTINLSKLSNGVFIVKITNEKSLKTMTKKFVKI